MKWCKSESTIRPNEVDTTSSKKVVYLRKNIVEKQRETEIDGDTQTYYEYEEAKLTKEEYEKYLQSLNLINIQQLDADLNYIAAMMGIEL